jgi:hypothetical protein
MHTTTMVRLLEHCRGAEEKMGAALGVADYMKHYSVQKPREEDIKRLQSLSDEYHKFLLDIQEHAREDGQV